MPKLIAAEKASAGLRHAVVCPNVMGRTKDSIAQSKRSRTSTLRVFLFADTMLALSFLWRSFYLFFFLSFCFLLYCFRRYAFIEAAVLRSIVLRCSCAPTDNTQVVHKCLCPPLFVCLFCVSLEVRCHCFRVLCTIAVSFFLCRVEYVVRFPSEWCLFTL